MKKEGFWVRLWMTYGKGNGKTEETYQFLTYENGFDEKDETLKSVAEYWAENDMRGYSRERYRYGFDVVSKPPNIWLENELKRLSKKQESIIHQENLIRQELGIKE